MRSPTGSTSSRAQPSSSAYETPTSSRGRTVVARPTSPRSSGWRRGFTRSVAQCAGTGRCRRCRRPSGGSTAMPSPGGCSSSSNRTWSRTSAVIEDALDDGPGPTGNPSVVVHERRTFAGYPSQYAGDGGTRPGVAGQGVGRTAGDQHHCVTDRRRRAPGREQHGAVVVAEQPGADRRLESLVRAGRPKTRHRTGISELEQLDCPFHVGQAAGSELEMRRRVGSPRQALGLDARLDTSDLAHLIDGQAAGRPAHRVHDREEALEQRWRTAQRSRPEQRLALPYLAPSPVVGRVRLERTYERTLTALRPKGGVEVQGGFRRR